MTISTIAFDFFGTLVKYEHTRSKITYDQTLAFLESKKIISNEEIFHSHLEQSFKILENQTSNSLKEFSMLDVMNLFLQLVEKELSEHDKDQLIKIYMYEWGKHIKYFPEIKNFISNLASKYNLCILSNTHYASIVYEHVEAMEISEYFTNIFTSIEIGYRKPSSKSYEHLMKEEGLDNTQLVYVGDNIVHDYHGALKVGIKPFLIDSKAKHLKVEERIESIFDLTNNF